MKNTFCFFLEGTTSKPSPEGWLSVGADFSVTEDALKAMGFDAFMADVADKFNAAVRDMIAFRPDVRFEKIGGRPVRRH